MSGKGWKRGCASLEPGMISARAAVRPDMASHLFRAFDASSNLAGWFDGRYDSMKTDPIFTGEFREKHLESIQNFTSHYIYSAYPEYTLKPEDSYDVDVKAVNIDPVDAEAAPTE